MAIRRLLERPVPGGERFSAVSGPSRERRGATQLLLALALSVLPVGELYYRFVYDASDGFDLGLASERWFERYYQRNAQGIRDSVNLSQKRLPDRPRFTFIGDSYRRARSRRHSA